MSKDITVLTPNGRRQKVSCTPDTNFLQVLEDVCLKQGFQPSDYDLKHHNHILDLTMTLRFSNLPNKAMLEMVETDRKRTETSVTIGLQLEDGERRTAEFAPTTTLYEMVVRLAPSEMVALQQPTVSYMRQEVVGEIALKEKTLRQLGLIKGRAIVRLLNKEEARQANVSAIYKKSVTESKVTDTDMEESEKSSETTKAIDINKDKYHQPDKTQHIQNKTSEDEKIAEPLHNVTHESVQEIVKHDSKSMDIDVSRSTSRHSQETLERRLKIEEEVTFLGNQKAIAFMPDSSEEDLEDLPDDFYELSVEEVRSLYHDLQQNRINLENSPLLSVTQREDQNKQLLEEKQHIYKNVVVRVQFPDHIILQGIFTPTNTVGDVINFIKEHLHNPSRQFHIFTTPLKEQFEPKMTLLEAKFVPCIHMHFKWLDNDTAKPYLKEETYSMKTPSDAACMLASKYRAPSRTSKQDNSGQSSQRSSKPSTSKGIKAPKWFKK